VNVWHKLRERATDTEESDVTAAADCDRMNQNRLGVLNYSHSKNVVS